MRGTPVLPRDGVTTPANFWRTEENSQRGTPAIVGTFERPVIRALLRPNQNIHLREYCQ